MKAAAKFALFIYNAWFHIIAWAGIIFFLAPFFYALAFCQIAGDDFDFITKSMFVFDLPGAFYEIGRTWLTWSGRYLHHFLAVLFGSILLWPFGRLIIPFCTIILYILAFSIITKHFTASINLRLIFSFLAMLCIFLCHPAVYIFYSYTNVLSNALQCVLFLLYLGFLINLWINWQNNQPVKIPWKKCLAAGICAAGIYETAALGVFFSTLCVIVFAFFKCKKNITAIKPFLSLFAWICTAIFISFLAPGNFFRAGARGISSSLKLLQIQNVPLEWLKAFYDFIFSIFPAASLLLAILLFAMQKSKIENPVSAGLTAIFSFLLYSIFLILLLALTDTPYSSSDKNIAHFSIYAAIALTTAIFCFLNFFCINWQAQKKLKQKTIFICIISIFALPFFSENYKLCTINSANGTIMSLAEFIQAREKAIAKIKEIQPAIWPSFGLKGELEDKNARKPAIKSAGPHILLDVTQSAAFPIYFWDSISPKPETWPNLWAAWAFGVGSICAVNSNPAFAIDKIKNGNCIKLYIPHELSNISDAWLVKARGNQNFELLWLIIAAKKTLQQNIGIFMPSSISCKRLAPVFMQKIWLNDLEKSDNVTPVLKTRLAGKFISFETKNFLNNQFYAFPLGLANASSTNMLFINEKGKNYYKLTP